MEGLRGLGALRQRMGRAIPLLDAIVRAPRMSTTSALSLAVARWDEGGSVGHHREAEEPLVRGTKDHARSRSERRAAYGDSFSRGAEFRMGSPSLAQRARRG